MLDIAARAQSALARPEAWQLYEDVALALDWMMQRRIPMAVVADHAIDVNEVLRAAGIKAPVMAVAVDSSLSNAFWKICKQYNVDASEVLYVAADFTTDFEDARSIGSYPLVIDRDGAFDESVPSINHLVEVELHI